MSFNSYRETAVQVFSFFFLTSVTVLIASAFLRSESFAQGMSGTVNESTGGTWRKGDGLHPIQVEMRPYVREMIKYAFDSYIQYAFPKDDLCSLSGSGKNSMGGYAMTLIDTLDTLAVAGLHTEFRKYGKWIDENVQFNVNSEVSVFETSIRTIGGLLGAHFMYEAGVVKIVPEEHDYKAGFLRLAADLADHVVSCFNTNTGIPFSAFRKQGNSTVCVGGITDVASGGTFLLEMTALSKLTGNNKYESAARRASEALFAARSSATGLMGSHININSGDWYFTVSHMAGGIDSAIEYFIKSHTMSGNIADWERFEQSVQSINQYLMKGGMLLGVHMNSGERASSNHESLSSFFSGSLLLGGHHAEAIEFSWPIHTIFKHFGALPESFFLNGGYPVEYYYIQRPEHVESLYYLYRATRDPAYLVMGKELALSLNLRLRTEYGFATLHDVSFPHTYSRYKDEMESFLLAETLKYLYLLFDECNVINIQGKLGVGVPSYCASAGTEHDSTGTSVGWIFNTEAHLFPNTAEWWSPMSEDGKKGDGDLSSEKVHTRRLRVIDGLLKILEDNNDNDRGGGPLSQQHYCANHILTDMDRISRSIFR